MKINEINNATLIWGIACDDALRQLKAENSLVIVPEQRPSLAGIKHNVALLKKRKINFVYCTDNMLGILFYKGRIKKTLIFGSWENEGSINQPGSLYVSLLSRLHNVPVWFVFPGEPSFEPVDTDASTIGGKDFILQEDKSKYIIKPLQEYPQEV